MYAHLSYNTITEHLEKKRATKWPPDISNFREVCTVMARARVYSVSIFYIGTMRESCTPDQVQRRFSHFVGELENRVTSIYPRKLISHFISKCRKPRIQNLFRCIDLYLWMMLF